jgi:hypothetical protein
MDMPRIARFANSEIAMFFADHNPPHFHVLGRDGQAQVRIDDLTVMAMSGRVDLREALGWAGENKTLLWERWNALSGN